MPSFPSPSRRSVLRTAAWSVPAVTVAAAAPAYATSGDGAALLPIGTGSTVSSNGVHAYTTVMLSPGAAGVPAGTTVTLTHSAGYHAPNAPQSITTSGTGWTFSPATPLGDGRHQVVATAASGAATSFQLHMKYQNGNSLPTAGNTVTIISHVPGGSPSTPVVLTLS